MRPDGVTSGIATPRRTSPLGALFGLTEGDRLRTLVPVVVIGVSSGQVAVLVVALALWLGWGILVWWRRTWCFADGVLHLDEGVLVRNQRRIPAERIQHVELEQRLRHQLFGLAALRVETAGGSGAELRLDAIPLREAETARTVVVSARRPEAEPARRPEAEPARRPEAEPAREPERVAPPPPPPPPEVLVHLPWQRLALAGITGPEVAAVLAAVAFAVDTLVDLGVDPGDVDGVDVSTLAAALLVAVAVPVWLATAGLVGLVRRWDLTAVVDGEELRVTYGLLRRAELVLRTERVQDVRISHRLLLRPFGRADVRVRTAASGAGDQSRIDIPLLAPDEIERVLARVMPAAAPLPRLVPAPPGARRRAWVRGGAGGGIAGLTVALAAIVAGAVAPLPVVLAGGGLLIGLASGEAAYRGLGAWVDRRPGGTAHARRGALTRRHGIVPRARVQSGAVVSTWFQRRRGLATVRLDLAGAQVEMLDRRGPEARELLAGCL